jgi:CRISPR-associated protein Cmr6
MYRAQVQGRCNLQYAGDSKNALGPDLEKWKTEWVQPQRNQEPSYRYHYDELDSDRFNTSIYAFQVRFPYRVFTNSGQDSIARPVCDRYGIPFIPGSSVKGILRRGLNSAQFDDQQKSKIKEYCGDEEHPGTLRFHGAYPLGNWANRMIDVVHPQQDRQVERNRVTSASALISFYEPTFLFELSSAKQDIDWSAVEELVRQALQAGLGGKTSTGYGFASPPAYADAQQAAYNEAKHIAFEGVGISSVLLDGKPEFRPNLFKATLRGHLQRLLAGVCNSESAVKQEVNRLLGGTDREGVIREGVIQLFWEDHGTQLNFQDQPITQEVKGTLHLAASAKAHPQDLKFVEEVLKFAYVMGGFGKSWRRVWHKQFYVSNPKYKHAIGCHWTCPDSNWWTARLPKTNADPISNLKTFLEKLQEDCRNRLGAPSSIATWRESWCLDRVALYSKVVNQSQAITLFHEPDFKTTPAIGGKNPGDTHPTSVSSTWHRMLPISDGQYLEIVTVFYGKFDDDRSPWQPEGVDRLHPFIQKLKEKQLTLTWGTPPPPPK